MDWYGWLLLGIVIGLVISRYLPARTQISGTIKQKGRNTSNNISDIKIKPEKARKRKLISNIKQKRNGIFSKS